MSDWPNPQTIADAIERLNPTSWWKMAEGSGSFADSGPGGISGTFAQGTRAAAGPRKDDGSVSANNAAPGAGVSAVATFGDVYDFAARAVFSAIVIHRPVAQGAASNSTYRVLSKEGEWQVGLAYDGNAGGPKLDPFRWGSPVNPTSSNRAAPGFWHLYGLSYDGSNLMSYLDGAVAVQADTTSNTDNANTLQLNGNPSNLVMAGGNFSHTAIWSGVALTQDDFDSIYAQF